MELLKYILPIFIAFSAGLVISGAVFAFITIIGLVPRMAQKTKTQNNIKVYESAIVLGGIFGTIAVPLNLHLPIGWPFVILITISIGIFYGTLAMSLAETLNVIPILSRRAHIQKGMFFFILAVAFGKLTGSLPHALVPGFYSPGG